MGDLLRPEDRIRVDAIAAEGETAGDRTRARILADFDDGLSMREVAERADTSVQRVLHWRREYLKGGLAMFEEGDAD